MRTDRPILVVGCPRSGTTLLQTMLHAHPRIAIPPENRFLLPLYDGRNSFGDLRETENRRAVARWITGRKATRFADLGLDPNETDERIVAAPPTIGSAAATVLRGYSARFGKARWGDKRPGYIQRLDTLLRLFPDAAVVHLVRDGRDCVASLMEMPWWRLDVCHATATWASAMDLGARAAASLPADAYHELRYEDLVAEPERLLTELCAFLGEEYHPAMARASVLAADVVPERKSWHARTRDAVTTERSGTWRQRLGADDAALCETVLARRLHAHGYPVDGTTRPSAGRLSAYRKVRTRRAAAQAKRRAADLARRMRERGPVADLTGTRIEADA